MRILITGHKGYIGGNLFRALQEQGHNVAGIDLEGCTIEGEELAGEDICEGYTMKFYEYEPEIVFHLAAIPRVGYSVEHPVEVMKNNVISTSKTLKFAKHFSIPVIYSSSSSVIGNGDGPTNPYALSKLCGEMETILYNSLYGIKTVALRYFNVYSKDQKADGPYATAVANWMKYIREGRSPFITGDGSQRRDMAHVDDVVSANIFCMDNIDKVRGETFDVGTGNNVSLNEMKEIVNKVLPDIKFDNVPPRPGEVMETKANIKYFKKFGWHAKIDIENGITHCFNTIKGEKT